MLDFFKDNEIIKCVQSNKAPVLNQRSTYSHMEERGTERVADVINIHPYFKGLLHHCLLDNIM